MKIFNVTINEISVAIITNNVRIIQNSVAITLSPQNSK